MKKTIAKIALFLFAVILIAGSVSAQDKAVKLTESKIKTSAQCEHCKDRIETKMKVVEGISSVVLNLNDKVMTVKYNTEIITLEKVRKALNKIGYDADDQPADGKAYKKLPKCCKKPEDR